MILAATITFVDSAFQHLPAEDLVESVRFRFRVSPAHYDIVQRTLQFRGTIEPDIDAKGIAIVYIIVGVVALRSLAETIIVLRRQLIQPGLKIDARGDEISIEIAPELPRGTILLIDKTDAKLYEPQQFNTTGELIGALKRARAK